MSAHGPQMTDGVPRRVRVEIYSLMALCVALGFVLGLIVGWSW